MSKIFEREDRYLVFKVSELTSEQIRVLTAWNTTVKAQRLEKGKDALTVVVVESGWPEYETVWDVIQSRMNAKVSCAKDKTKHLIKKREETEARIDELQCQVFTLTREMCAIDGDCPLCLNTHYPHCSNAQQEGIEW